MSNNLFEYKQNILKDSNIDEEKNEVRFFFDSDNPNEKIEGLRELFRKVIKNETKGLSNEFKEVFQILRNFYDKISELHAHVLEISDKIGLHNDSQIFVYNDIIENENKKIQRYFLDFSLKILTYSYKDLSFEVNTSAPRRQGQRLKRDKDANKTISSSSKDKFVVKLTFQKKSKDNVFYFIEQFYTTSKINPYLINFMLYFDTLDLYKIPLLITDNLVNFIKYRGATELTQKFDSFEIFDYIFKVRNKDDLLNFNELIKREIDEEGETKFFTYSQFFLLENQEFYKKLIRDRQEYDGTFRIESFKDRGRIATRFIYMSTNFELVNEFLLDYIYRLKQLPDEDFKKMIQISNSLDGIEFQKIKQSFVSDVYEQYLFSKKIYKNEYYYIFSIFMLFSLINCSIFFTHQVYS